MRMRKSLFFICLCVLTSCSSLDAGWKAQKSGDYEEAQRQAIIALAKEPRNPDVYRLISATAISRGEFDSAAKSAEFASSLDGGSAQSEKLVRQAYALKQSWPDLCDAALRAAKLNTKFSDEENQWFINGFNQLQPKSSAYGCVAALESSQQSVVDGSKVKAAYASDIARRGQNREALTILDSLSDPEFRLLEASKCLYALQQTQEAQTRLRAYANDNAVFDIEKEQRIIQAADVCELNHDYALAAELLGLSSSNHTVQKGIALRRAFKKNEADAAFDIYFDNPERTPKQTLNDIQLLLNAGYTDTAVKAIQTCPLCHADENISFNAADLFINANLSSAAVETLTGLAENDDNNLERQKNIYNWYRSHALYPQALTLSERLQKLGANDEDFVISRLDTMVKCKEIAQFDRESRAYIQSLPAPAASARTQIARLELERKNYPAAQQLLQPLDDNKQLTGDSLSIYIESLDRQHLYEKLDSTFDLYIPDMAPEKRAAYFNDLAAETQYKKSLEPMLKGSESERLDASLLLADFYYTKKNDVESGNAFVNQALEASHRSSLGYERTTNFLNSHQQRELAVDYAKAWHNAYLSETKPLTVLALMYLRDDDIDNADLTYDEYINVESDKYKALNFVYNEYSRYNHSDAGLAWIEKQTEAALKNGENPDYREVRANSRKTIYQKIDRNSNEAHELRTLAIDDYNQLVKSKQNSAIKYAYALSSLQAYDDAVNAFEAASKIDDPDVKPEEFSKEYAFAAIRTHRSDKDIQKIVDNVKEPKNVFDIAVMLEREQSLYLAKNILKKTLKSDSQEVRDRAFSYLIQISTRDGDTKQIADDMKAYEEQAPNNPDVRLKLALISIERHNWDEAVRHLTWLQAMRPDARDVLQAQMRLARRAVDHVAAQNLMSTTLDAAEGVFHRLDWISQEFALYGDNERALFYALKAWDASTVQSDALRLRMIELFLKSGQFDPQNDDIKNHLDALNSSGLLNSTRLENLAEIASNAGYEQQAQEWLRQAVALDPSQPALKKRKLEMALDADHQGQIAINLEQAIEAPVAEVMDPLRNAGAYADAIDAIDQFEQNGEFQMAVSSLLSILPQYIESRGISAAQNILKRFVDAAPEYQSVIYAILANIQLAGESPCDAYPFARQTSDPNVWAKLAILCNDARETIFGDIRNRRHSMTHRQRAQFDEQFVQTLGLASDGHVDFALNSGIDLSTLQQFNLQLSQNHLLSALTVASVNPVSDDEHLPVISQLSLNNYQNEAVAYAQDHLYRMSDINRRKIAAGALLLGANDTAFKKSVASEMPEGLQHVNGSSSANIADIDTLKTWLKSSALQNIPAVFEFAVKASAAQPSQRKMIVDAIISEIQSRHDKSSLYTSFALIALEHGLYEESLQSFDLLKTFHPDSDYVDRARSVALARLSRDDDAWTALLNGARDTADLDDYWLRAANAHADSEPRLQQRINNARLALAPHQPKLLVNASVLALQNKQIDEAVKLAKEAFNAGGIVVSKPLAEAFEQNQSLNRLPKEIYEGNTSPALDIQARMALASGDAQAAAQLLALSAQRAPWPVDIYNAQIERLIRQKSWPRAEQLIAQFDEKWPHSSAPMAWRAIYDLNHHKIDDAWMDYLAARSKAIDGDFAALIAAHALMNQHEELAQKIIAYEKSHLTFNISAFVLAVCHVFSDDQYAELSGKSKAQFAQIALRFIENYLPLTINSSTHNDDLRAVLNQLALRAQDQSWLNRLSILAL